MKLKIYDHIVREDFNTRSYRDNRKRVNRIVISYKNDKGEEFRKSYEYPSETSRDMILNDFPRQIK